MLKQTSAMNEQIAKLCMVGQDGGGGDCTIHLSYTTMEKGVDIRPEIAITLKFVIISTTNLCAVHISKPYLK